MCSLLATQQNKGDMKCQVCRINEARNGSMVCSDRCNKVRLMIIKLSDKYTPTPGCENCWGDLHQECTEKCKNEFRASFAFVNDLYELVRIIFTESHVDDTKQ